MITMFENIKPEDRGQVGIGTLIVFIALVLVAAIAAGVLINTAGFLQTQAESTGQESTDQVSNNVQVFSTTGTYNSGGTTAVAGLSDVTFTLGLSPGSDPVNLENVTLEYVGPHGPATQELLESDGAVSYALVNGQEATILENSTERTELTVDLDDQTNAVGILNTDGTTRLQEGENAQFRLITPAGSQRTIEITVDDPLIADDGDEIPL